MVKDKLAALSKLALLPWLQIYQDNIENRRESSDSLMDVYTVTLMASITCWLYKTYVGKVSSFSGFSLGRLHMGGFAPPDMGGEDKALMGGGDTDLMGGPNSDRLYHKLKVLQLLLSCNYTIQFVSYDSIKTH